MQQREKKEVLLLKLESFSKKDIERSAQRFKFLFKISGNIVRGPIPLPNRTKRFTLLRSPFKHKKSQDKYLITNHSRLFFIPSPRKGVVATILKWDFLSSVSLTYKVVLR